MIKTILDFLFGKSPDIFDESGQVHHQYSKKQWDAWSKRYSSSPEMNWRNHTGTKAKLKK